MRNLACYFLFVVLLNQASSHSKADFLLEDGDFTNWSFGYYDYGSGFPVGSIARLSTGGNPGAYVSGTSPVGQLGPLPYAIYNGFSTDQAIEGEHLILAFDLRTNYNPGLISGINVYAAVEQNGTVYYQVNALLQGTSSWDRSGWDMTVRSSGFSSLDGTQKPIFSGGTATKFGFAITSNSTSVDIDNLRLSLTLTAVPEPSSGVLMAGGLLILLTSRTRRWIPSLLA